MHRIYQAGIRITDQQSLAGLPAIGNGMNEDDEGEGVHMEVDNIIEP